MKKIEQSWNKILLTEIIYSVLYAILGLIIYLKPEITNNVIGLMIGTFLLIYGFFALFTFIERSKIKLFHWNFIFGILSILLGIFIMFNPLSILHFLNITVGIWLVVEGINKAVYYLFMKKIGEESRKIILASAMLLFILGVLLVLNPFKTIIISKTVGVFIILFNVVNINDLILLKRRGKKILELIK